MGTTYNRRPLSLGDPKINYKYFNQANWQGLSDDKNILTVNQESFEDCQNVYVNDEGMLKSRPATKIYTVDDQGLGNLSDILKVWTFDEVTVYKSESNDSKYLTFVSRDTIKQEELTPAEYGQDANIKLALIENKIFVFNELSLHYYDIHDASYSDANEFIYIPTTKIIVNDVESENESENELTTTQITKYIYDDADSLRFGKFVGKQITIILDDTKYNIQFEENQHLSFVEKLTKVPIKCSSAGYMLGENSAAMPLIDVSENGQILLTEVEYDAKEKTVTDMTLHYSADGITYSVLPELNDICGIPHLSKDGTYVAAFAEGATTPKGLYFYSVLKTEPLENGDVDYKYKRWKNVLENAKYKDIDILSFISIKYNGSFKIGSTDYRFPTGSEYRNNVFLNGVFDDYDNYCIVTPYDTAEEANSGNLNYYINTLSNSLQFNKPTLSLSKSICSIKSISNEFYVDLLDGFMNFSIPTTGDAGVTDAYVYLGQNKVKYTKVTYRKSGNYYILEFENGSNSVYISASPTTRTYDSNLIYVLSGQIIYVTVVGFNEYLSECHYHGLDVPLISYSLDYTIITNMICYITSQSITRYTNTRCNYKNQVAHSTTSLSEAEIFVKNSLKNAMYVSGNNIFVICQGTSNSYSHAIVYRYVFEQITDNSKLISVISNYGAYSRLTSTEFRPNSNTLLSYNNNLNVVISNRYIWPINDAATRLLFGATPVLNNYSPSIYLVSSNMLYKSASKVEIDVVEQGVNNYLLPDKISKLYNYYFSKNSTLYISSYKYVNENEFKLYLPKINTEEMDSKITNLCPISNTEMGIFLQDDIYYVSQDDTTGGYRYYKSKLSIGCKDGSDVITTFDGKNVIFVSNRGLVALSYQDFVASTEQTITYLSDTIHKRFADFNTSAVKLYQYEYWIVCYTTDDLIAYVYDIRNSSWWPMKCHNTIKDVYTLNYKPLILSNDKLYTISKAEEQYFDDDATDKIEWFIVSQKLHFGAINNYKHIVNMTLSSVNDDSNCNAVLQIVNYRKLPNDATETYIEYEINVARTFVKKINHFKVTNFQYRLFNDVKEAIQYPLCLSNVSLKYTITGEIK